MSFLKYFYPFFHGQVILLLKNRPRLIYKHELVPYGFIYVFFMHLKLAVSSVLNRKSGKHLQNIRGPFEKFVDSPYYFK